MKQLVWYYLFFFGATTLAQSSQGYYRFPAIYGDRIYFSAEGDIWTVGVEGGLARRLTTHPSEETHPVVSPDGRILAFTASYEGPTELYTMPVAGGMPVRQSYEASPSIAVGWTPDGRVLYSTREYSTLPDPQLVVLKPDTHERWRIPVTPAGDGVYDSSGKTLFFTRPAFHQNNTKRYQGGTARNIWKFREGDPEARNLTADFPGEDHSPMWWNRRIYYICDRDGSMNIWSMNEDGRDLQQHTRHSGWDVLSASQENGKIVYQLGADLRVHDIRTKQDRLIPINLSSDFDQLREKWVDKPIEYLTSAHIHPEGASVVLTSRGRVFVTPAKRGRLVRVSKKKGVRYRDASFMPDGESVFALSDESGELEWWSLPANGVGEGRPLTDDGEILRFRGYPSADGRYIAYTDKNSDLWLLEKESGNQTRVSTNREGVDDLAWSPDSRWLAYAQSAPNGYWQVHLYGVEDAVRKTVTSDRVNSRSPAWSPDGKFLYLLSDRNLRSLVGSPWGPRQPEPFFDKTMKIYEISLREGLRSPFRPDDELYRTDRSEERGQDREESESVAVEIDLQNLERRIREVPAPAGNYRGLQVNKAALFWVESATDDGSSQLMALKIDNQNPKPVQLADRVRSCELSADGSKLLATRRDEIYVLDALPKKPADLAETKVDLSTWTYSIDVREDFRQLFVDAWRLERDYFYDPGMHGVDWDAMLEKYLPLVDRVTTRMELSDLIGQLVGELSALHVSVRGGDHRRGKDQVRLAKLGARLERAAEAGGYRIAYVYQSDPDYPDERSPLADPDLGIEVGDIIEAINGTPTLDVPDPGVLLRNQQDKQVLLQLRSHGGESRRVIVTPTADEAELRYHDWEYTRRLRVEAEGGGDIGYVHLRAMGSGNLTEWYRNFYPVFNRKGLIIDVRQNRGGNIDSIILEKLLRKAWFYWKPRVGEPYWNMQYAFHGHMVVLCNEQTASDGEAFAEGFRRLGLGQLIGTRTWGGEIWLSSNNRLTDGGLARAPQTGVYGPEGEWLIEGHGVDPDIVVDNPPHATFRGEDAQLAAAIEYLKRRIREEPVDPVPPPPYPDKSFHYPKRETPR